MIKLLMNNNSFILNNNSKKSILSDSNGYKELKKLRIGSNITIESDNVRVQKHSGTYYLLFIEEYGEVNILYVDKQGLLRIVFMGMEDEVLKGLYYNVAGDMSVKLLKSSNKRAYRVVETINGELNVLEVEYKNKSSQISKQTYLTIQDAIKFASYNHRLSGNSYKVISPKGSVLYFIG